MIPATSDGQARVNVSASPAESRRASAGPGRARLTAIATGVVCALTAAYFVSNARDANRVRDANELGAAGDYRGALRASDGVTRPPQDARALLVRAYALLGLRRGAAASTAFARAAARDPNNWVIHRDWGILLLQLGRRAQAGHEMGRALALNPRMPLPPGFIRPVRK